MKDLEFPYVSIVLIGHNEGKTLSKSFEAIQHLEYPKDKLQIIFVDSNSTDNSIDIAQEYADKIISIKSFWPTAGEAFNVGIQRADYDFVHITAGDIFLNKDYLKKAIKTLQIREELGVVTGFFVEENETGWNKVIGFRREEDVQEVDHYVNTPNGGTFRRQVFIDVNGYDERIKKGQETEIGYRIKLKGHNIWHINTQQGVHNFDLRNVFGVISRYFVNGVSLGYILLLPPKERDNRIVKGFYTNAIKRLLMLIFYILMLALSISFKSYVFLILGLATYFLILPLRIIINNRKETKNYTKYQVTNSLFVAFTFMGILSFLFTYLILRLRGITIIEERKGLGIETSNMRTIIDVKI